MKGTGRRKTKKTLNEKVLLNHNLVISLWHGFLVEEKLMPE